MLKKYKNLIRRKLRSAVGYDEIIEKLNGCSGNSHYHYVGDNTALIPNPFGQWFFVDTRDLGLFPELLLHGSYERKFFDFYLATVKPDDVVIEVGANIGYYSVTTAALRHPKAYYAFDAHPRTAALCTATSFSTAWRAAFRVFARRWPTITTA